MSNYGVGVTLSPPPGSGAMRPPPTMVDGVRPKASAPQSIRQDRRDAAAVAGFGGG